MGRSSFFGYLSVANTSGVPARVSLARAWVLSLRLSSLQAAAPGGKGTFRDHLALPLKTSPLVFNANWDRHCCSQQASGFSGVNG